VLQLHLVLLVLLDLLLDLELMYLETQTVTVEDLNEGIWEHWV
jgi:hypothetical protein